MLTTEQLMAAAIQMSIENVASGGGPFAAIVARKGEIVASGVNRVTTSNDPTAHAEIVAIRTACNNLRSFRLSGCILISTCEPCPMCMGAIYWARPDEVYFAGDRQDAAAAGFDDSFIYDELAKPLNERRIPMHQIMRSEAAEAFRAWCKAAKNVRY